MSVAIKRWQVRESQFLFWVALVLLLIGGYLQHGGGAPSSGEAWRKVDLRMLQQKLDDGDLSSQEAAWYHPVEAAPQRERKAP
jgi:hypothetical protein